MIAGRPGTITRPKAAAPEDRRAQVQQLLAEIARRQPPQDLHPKQRVAFTSEANEILYGGAAGGGKALAIDTPIPTPDGWRMMGELRVGDMVFGHDGRPRRVIAATEVLHDRPCYEVCFSDGARIVADASHLWWTRSAAERQSLERSSPEFRTRRRALRPSRGNGSRPDLAARNSARADAHVGTATDGSIRTTEELAQSLYGAGGRLNHAVPVADCLALPDAELPVDPYTLGVWLGDGTSSQAAFTGAPSDVAHIAPHIEAAGYVVRARQRLALLQGLMDTDGSALKSGKCEFTTTSPLLRDGVEELLRSLGIAPWVMAGTARLNGRAIGPKWRLAFLTEMPAFRIPRKLDRQKRSGFRATHRTRYVVSVQPIASVPVRCIQVDDPNGLFLAGREMVTTHNSHLMRRAAITWCKWIKGLQVYLFRREFGDLFKNHMESAGGFRALLADEIARGECRIVDKQIRWRNGSTIHLCHCQHEKDVYGYQGAEIHVLMIDELTQWTRKMYAFLRGRVRLGGLKVPPWLKSSFPRILTSANPGGIGHNWVKADFVDSAPELTVHKVAKKEGGMRRQFIRALLEDNPTMTENDPDYEDRLEGLGDPSLVRAMRKGDWDIVSGGFFDDLWKRDRHVLKPFPIPSSWRIDRSFDWGSSKPFSVGWWAESDGTRVEVAPGVFRTFPRGSLIRIAEWYGCGDKPDEGLKLPSSQVADGIKGVDALLKVRGPRGETLPARVQLGPADSAIYDVVDTESASIGDTMAKRGVRWVPADKSPGSRKNGWERMRELLAEAAKDAPEAPGLWVFNICTHFIRTVPVLPRDPKKPDDVMTTAEDHIGDETRYRVLALSRVARRSSFSPV
jgi:hypothetical protein